MLINKNDLINILDTEIKHGSQSGLAIINQSIAYLAFIQKFDVDPKSYPSDPNVEKIVKDHNRLLECKTVEEKQKILKELCNTYSESEDAVHSYNDELNQTTKVFDFQVRSMIEHVILTYVINQTSVFPLSLSYFYYYSKDGKARYSEPGAIYRYWKIEDIMDLIDEKHIYFADIDCNKDLLIKWNKELEYEINYMRNIKGLKKLDLEELIM